VKVSCEDQSGPVWRVALLPDEGEDVSITLGGLVELTAIIDGAAEAQHCRALVLDGSPGCFCRGMNLQVATTIAETERQEGSRLFAECLCRLRGARQLVIAAIDGDALAGGLGLVAAADVALATERSIFGLPELMLGLLPAMVLPLLMERIGAQPARRLALSAASVTAQRAFAIGLVDELVADPEQLERKLRSVLKATLRVQPDAVAELKRFSAEIAFMDYRDAVMAGRALTDERLSRPDIREAISDFLSGEPLPWLDRYRPNRKP
jgi:enoyl-CoA hydratase/carnithine racemase